MRRRRQCLVEALRSARIFWGAETVTIELRHIRHVIAAAEHGSFRRAAIALRTQQSSISRSIGDIEYRLGATLFVRRPSGVKLTPAGKRFVDRASSAMAERRLCSRWAERASARVRTTSATAPVTAFRTVTLTLDPTMSSPKSKDATFSLFACRPLTYICVC